VRNGEYFKIDHTLSTDMFCAVYLRKSIQPGAHTYMGAMTFLSHKHVSCVRGPFVAKDYICRNESILGPAVFVPFEQSAVLSRLSQIITAHAV